jgi:putative DNA primase/helicase
MGMAVKSELGDDGFEIWDKWSQAGATYKERDAQSVWRSIKPGGGVTLGTLFHEATANGWQSDGQINRLSTEENEIRKQQDAKRTTKAEAEKQARQKEAARTALEILKNANGDPASHQYSIKKCVSFGNLIKRGTWPQRGWTDALLMPVYNESGKVVTVQAINEDGTKDLLFGGKKKGCFYPLGKIRKADTILIGEGLATVAAGVKTTGLPGVVAIDVGNLLEVGKVVRELAPKAEIVFLADDDQDGDKNPGIESATKAARTVNGKVAFPGMGKKADFWDLWSEQGSDAVKQCVAGTSTQTDTQSVVLVPASSLKMQTIDWIWHGWLAGNKLHIIAGAPGTGKTTIALSLAATITRGGFWPDGSKCQAPGNVLIWSGEDDPADTLLPRLVAAGADLNRIKFITAVNDTEGKRSFDPARDMAELEQKVKDWRDICLLVCDPVVSAVRGDSHKNAEVRRGLQPLVDFGQRLGAAVVGISHFTKGTAGREPLERVCGSLAFGALARIVLGSIKDQKEPERRILARMKSNIGPDGGGFVYNLETKELEGGVVSSVIKWGEVLEGEARTLLGDAEKQENPDGTGGVLEDAESFLKELLKDGPLSAKQVKIDSSEAGFAWATIRRAKDRLRIKPKKQGMDGGWQWELPPKVLKKSEDVQQNLKGTFDNLEHLRENCEVF